jgi:hypothetical protein
MAKSNQGLLWAAISCLLLAVGAYFLAREQERIRLKFGDAPQTITVAQLAENGYGDNVWVDLTDAELLPKPVVETRKGSISAVWVAVLPQGQADNAQEIKVILRSSHCKNEAEIAQKFEPRASFRGAVINPLLLQPHDPYRPLLQEAFPNLKLASTIWEVDIDYHKPSEKWASGFYVATAVLAFLGIICGAAWCFLAATSAVRGDQRVRAELQSSIRE